MASLPALPSILKPVWLTPTAVAKSSAHPAAVLVIRCHRLNRCGISSTNEAYAGWSDRAANNPAGPSIYQIVHGQEFVGRWNESDFIESHDADMSNVLAAIHYPHSRIVKTRRGCDMRHHKSVHIDACNEISIAMGKAPENVLPLYLSVMQARHVHKLMLIEFLEKIVHMAKEIMEISPDIKDQ